jgi:hypothetical protein
VRTFLSHVAVKPLAQISTDRLFDTKQSFFSLGGIETN